MSQESGLRVIIGGTLIDGTGRPPLKDSVVLIRDRKIAAVGKRDEFATPDGAEVIDAGGKTVLPGLIDAHTHFLNMGIRMIREVDLANTRSLSEAVVKVKERVARVEPGEWVLGRGWDDSKWIEKRFINKDDLDNFSQGNPIVLTRICGHLVTLNSKALETAGIIESTGDPPGGEVEKGPDGKPTGILKDARQLVNRYIPPISEETSIEGLSKACRYALSLGCTGIHDAGIAGPEIKVYQKAAESGVLRIRANLMWKEKLYDEVDELNITTRFGSDVVRLGPAKILMDGSLGARTAALYDAYEDDKSTKGLLMMTVEELEDKVKKIHKKGSQLAIHAIGDYGIEVVINAIEAALKEAPRRDHRHRIEHCEILTSTQIERIKQLGIIASVQPNFPGEWSGPGGLYESRLGSRRLRQNNPFRYLIDEGIPLPFGSDGMPFSPLYGIWSAVNHPVKHSRIKLEEAVKSYSLESAYASFEENVKGSVEKGKLADIVILDRDITEMPSEEIDKASVYMTIIGGETLYHKEDAPVN
jgi:predicted amidohydrolase YtcJ